jgi:hypothetical protein
MTPQRRLTLPWAGAVLAAALSLAPAPAWCQLAASKPDPKANLAEEILSAREAGSGQALDPAFRKEVIAKLRTQSLEVLQATARGENQDALKFLTYLDSLVYTPVAPCRILDTRIGHPLGPLQVDEFRPFTVTGNLLPQGGASDCRALPPGRALVAVISLATVNASGGGYLQTEPWSASPTEPNLSSIMTYSPGLALSNVVPIALCNPLLGACTNDFFLRSRLSTVHVVGDIVGYFSMIQPSRYQTQVIGSATPDTQVPVPLGTVCAPLMFSNAFIDTSTPSHFTAQGSVRLSIDHVQGSDDEIHVCLAQSGCCQPGTTAVHRIPAAFPTASGIQVTLPLVALFPYIEDTGFTVNGYTLAGTGATKFLGASFVVEVIPN